MDRNILTEHPQKEAKRQPINQSNKKDIPKLKQQGSRKQRSPCSEHGEELSRMRAETSRVSSHVKTQ